MHHLVSILINVTAHIHPATLLIINTIIRQDLRIKNSRLRVLFIKDLRR